MTCDPLRRPDDWVPASQHPAHPSDVNVPRYRTNDGLEHWWDVRNGIIRTNDPTISLSFHSFSSLGYTGHSYAKLNFDGNFATITQDGATSSDVTFFPDFGDRTDCGELIWHIDHIFRTFDLPDHEQYPWVTNASVLPNTTVRGMTRFLNLDQQKRFIFLVATLLSCHDAVPGRAVRGEKARGKVVFGDKLKHAFKTGQFIN